MRPARTVFLSWGKPRQPRFPKEERGQCAALGSSCKKCSEGPSRLLDAQQAERRRGGVRVVAWKTVRRPECLESLKLSSRSIEAQQRWRPHGNRGKQSLPGGNLGTTVSLRVALRIPRRNEVCGINSPPAWKEPGFSGKCARFLSKRTCGG